MKCCEVNAGALREPVAFKRKTETPDGAGGYTEAWADIAGAATLGAVKGLSGVERWASDRVEATTRYRLTVRYFEGLTEVDAVVIRGRWYNIRFVDNLELRNQWLVIDLDGGSAVRETA